jgi:dipeptide/tripeptide permease
MGAQVAPERDVLHQSQQQTRAGFHYGFGAAAIGRHRFSRSCGRGWMIAIGSIEPVWIIVRLVVGIMAVFAVSELLLSPIGLSITTKLAPEAFRAQMMALYFFSVGLGTSMSGVLARFYDPAHEFAYFGIIGAVAIVAGVVVFAIAPWISRLMEGVH